MGKEPSPVPSKIRKRKKETSLVAQIACVTFSHRHLIVKRRIPLRGLPARPHSGAGLMGAAEP